MKKIILLLAAPFVFFTAQSDTITQPEADSIALERLSQETRSYTLYAKDSVQQQMTITSAAGEVLEVNYKFWVYYVSYISDTEKYLFVKESNGKLLEVNVKSEAKPEDLSEWRIVEKPCHCIMDTLKGEWSWVIRSANIIGYTENEFKSVLKIISQNEDTSINYEVFVEDTLFSSGSFQIHKDLYYCHYQIDNILPHGGLLGTEPYGGYWCMTYYNQKHPLINNEKILTFSDNYFEGYIYFYEKIK